MKRILCFILTGTILLSLMIGEIAASAEGTVIINDDFSDSAVTSINGAAALVNNTSQLTTATVYEGGGFTGSTSVERTDSGVKFNKTSDKVSSGGFGEHLEFIYHFCYPGEWSNKERSIQTFFPGKYTVSFTVTPKETSNSQYAAIRVFGTNSAGANSQQIVSVMFGNKSGYGVGITTGVDKNTIQWIDTSSETRTAIQNGTATFDVQLEIDTATQKVRPYIELNGSCISGADGNTEYGFQQSAVGIDGISFRLKPFHQPGDNYLISNVSLTETEQTSNSTLEEVRSAAEMIGRSDITATPDDVKDDLDLPETAGDGSVTVSWQSLNTDIIGNDGVIATTDEATTDTVIIRGTFSKNGIILYKDYEITATTKVRIQEALPTPDAPTWDGTALKWNAVSNAEKYTVKIYCDGILAETVSELTATTLECEPYLEKTGQYTATVMAHSVQYLDSEESSPSEAKQVTAPGICMESDFSSDSVVDQQCSVVIGGNNHTAKQYIQNDALVLEKTSAVDSSSPGGEYVHGIYTLDGMESWSTGSYPITRVGRRYYNGIYEIEMNMKAEQKSNQYVPVRIVGSAKTPGGIITENVTLCTVAVQNGRINLPDSGGAVIANTGGLNKNINLKIRLNTSTKKFYVTATVNGTEYKGSTDGYDFTKMSNNTLNEASITGVKISMKGGHQPGDKVHLYNVVMREIDAEDATAVSANEYEPQLLAVRNMLDAELSGVESEYLEKDIELPDRSSGNENIAIKWISSDSGALTNDGKIGLITSEREVVLRAVITLDCHSLIKDYRFKLKKNANEADTVDGRGLLLHEDFKNKQIVDGELAGWAFEDTNGQTADRTIESDTLTMTKTSGAVAGSYGERNVSKFLFRHYEQEYSEDTKTAVYSDFLSGKYNISMVVVPKIKNVFTAVRMTGMNAETGVSSTASVAIEKSAAYIVSPKKSFPNGSYNNKEHTVQFDVDTAAGTYDALFNTNSIEGISISDAGTYVLTSAGVSLKENDAAGTAVTVKDIKITEKERCISSLESAVDMIMDSVPRSSLVSNPDAVTSNLTLPRNDGKITWSSSAPDIISNDGVLVERPVGADKTVVMTAAFTRGNLTKYKEYYLIVKEETDPEKIIEMAKEKLTYEDFTQENPQNISMDLNLPAVGEYDSVITWKSSDATILTDEGAIVKNNSGLTVTNVSITATIERGGLTATKDFPLRVVVLPENNLALGKPTSSDVLSALGADAMLATDGLVTTGWQTKKESDLPVLTIDLGEAELVNNIVLFESMVGLEYPITAYAVRGSVNGSDYFDIIEGSTIGEIKELSFDVVRARYFQFEVLNKAETVCGLSEVVVCLGNDDASIAAADLTELKESLGNLIGLTNNIALPTVGTRGTAFEYSSSDSTALANDGTVTRGNMIKRGNLIVYGKINGSTVAQVSIPFSVLGQGSNSGGTPVHSGGGGGAGGSSLPSLALPQTNVDPSISAPGSVFIDVDEPHWAYEYIKVLTENNIVSGDGNGYFRPQDEISREEFLKLLMCALDIPVSDGDLRYEDVEADSWYAPYLCGAEKIELIKGISETQFGVGTSITREDMSVLCSRALAYLNRSLPTVNTQTFHDADDISDYALDSVKYLKGAGVLSGFDDGNFYPKRCTTRAEAAKLICLLIG